MGGKTQYLKNHIVTKYSSWIDTIDSCALQGDSRLADSFKKVSIYILNLYIYYCMYRALVFYLYITVCIVTNIPTRLHIYIYIYVYIYIYKYVSCTKYSSCSISLKSSWFGDSDNSLSSWHSDDSSRSWHSDDLFRVRWLIEVIR